MQWLYFSMYLSPPVAANSSYIYADMLRESACFRICNSAACWSRLPFTYLAQTHRYYIYLFHRAQGSRDKQPENRKRGKTGRGHSRPLTLPEGSGHTQNSGRGEETNEYAPHKIYNSITKQIIIIIINI